MLVRICLCITWVSPVIIDITFDGAVLWKAPTVTEGKKNNDGEEMGDEDLNIASLKHQLSTLTSSLYTVTEQKSRMEATYVSDKRKLKVR